MIHISCESRVDIHIHTSSECGSKCKTENTLTHVVCNGYLLLTGYATVNLSRTNARFVFRVGKINIPIHKC